MTKQDYRIAKSKIGDLAKLLADVKKAGFESNVVTRETCYIVTVR